MSKGHYSILTNRGLKRIYILNNDADGHDYNDDNAHNYYRLLDGNYEVNLCGEEGKRSQRS